MLVRKRTFDDNQLRSTLALFWKDEEGKPYQQQAPSPRSCCTSSGWPPGYRTMQASRRSKARTVPTRKEEAPTGGGERASAGKGLGRGRRRRCLQRRRGPRTGRATWTRGRPGCTRRGRRPRWKCTCWWELEGSRLGRRRRHQTRECKGARPRTSASRTREEGRHHREDKKTLSSKKTMALEALR